MFWEGYFMVIKKKSLENDLYRFSLGYYKKNLTAMFLEG